MQFKPTIDLSRFSVVELIALIGMLTICGILTATCLVGIWRPVRIEVVERVYRLLDQILALIAGLLGAGVLAGKKAQAKEPALDSEPTLKN